MADGGETNYMPNARSYADKNGVQTPERSIPHTYVTETPGNGEAEMITGATRGPDGKFICLKSDYQIQLENEALPLRDQYIQRQDQTIKDFGINNGYLNQDGSAVPGMENSFLNDSYNLREGRDFAYQQPLSDFLSGTKSDHLAYMINRDQLIGQLDSQNNPDLDSQRAMHCKAKHAVRPDTDLNLFDRTFKTASGAKQRLAELVGTEAPMAVLTGGIVRSASIAMKAEPIGVRQVIPDRTVGFVEKEADNVAPPAKPVDETQTTKLPAGEPVSVANGEYLETWHDFLIPGTLPFNGARYMGLKLGIPSGYVSPLGPCQISMFDEIFSNPERGKLVFHDANGKAIPFDRPFNFLPSVNAGYPHLGLKAPWLKQLKLKDRGITKHFRQYEDDVYRLEQIDDLNGNSLVFQRSEQGWLEAVTGPDGLSLRFENDDQGRRNRIVLIGLEGTELELAHYTYDPTGRMTAAHCTFGMSVLYVWQADANLLVSWNNLTGQSETHFTYDAQGRVTHTRTNGIWNGDRFEYVEGETRYAPGGNEQSAQTFRYDEHENITEEIDPLGGVVAHAYNRYGFRTATTDQNGNANRTSYDANGNVKEVVDAEGRSTIYGWGDNGELMIVIDGAGNRKTFEHDDKANVIAEKDAEGNVTRLIRDDLGHAVETHFATGAIECRTWDKHNRVESITDAKGNTTRFEYDEFNRLAVTIGPNGGRTSRYYSAGAGGFDTVSRITRADGVAVNRSFDSAGQLASVTDGEGRVWRYRYGAFGVLEAIVDPKGGELSLATDIEGRLISVTNAAGRIYSFERDVAGRVVTEEDFDDRLWRYRRDPAGRITQTTKPDGARLAYSYDKTGLVKRIESITAKGEPDDVTRFWYDGRGLLIRAENNAALVEFARDRNGRIISEALNGKRIRSKHDGIGQRIRREILGLGGSITDYVRDPLGAVEKLVADDTEISFERDIFGQEKARRMGGFNLLQRFDPAGQLVAQVAGPAMSNGLDVSRLGWRFDRGAGPKPSGAIPGHIQRTYEYDRAFAPVSIDDGLWGKRQFTYDDNGQLTDAEAASGTERFAYDSARNLAGASSSVLTSDDTTPYGPAFDQTFGSVIPAAAPGFWQRSAGGVVQMARGPKGERIQLTHDDCGRLIERRVERDGFRPQRWRYGWDVHDRLVSVTTLEGEEWYFRYDPFGRRISKVRRFTGEEKDRVRRLWPDLVRENGRPVEKRLFDTETNEDRDHPDVGTAYLWDGDHMVAEAPLRLDGHVAWDQSTQWYFEDGTHRLLAKRQADGEMLAVVCDHLGMPKEMFDAKGKLVWAADYHVWGAVRVARTFGPLAETLKHDRPPDEQHCPWRFPGQYEDAETGLYYNRYRHYDALTGQYTSPDPIGLAGGDRPQGYVDNPSLFVDVLGLSSRLESARGYEKRWGPHEDGPLGDPNNPQTPAATFRSGSYTERVLEEPLVVYRAYGGDAGPVGQYMTSVRPAGPTQSILDSALNPAWGNSATQVHSFTLPAGTGIFDGFVGEQLINGGAGSLYGGGSQIFVPRTTLQQLRLMP